MVQEPREVEEKTELGSFVYVLKLFLPKKDIISSLSRLRVVKSVVLFGKAVQMRQSCDYTSLPNQDGSLLGTLGCLAIVFHDA